MINDQEIQDQLDLDQAGGQEYEEHQYESASNDYSSSY